MKAWATSYLVFQWFSSFSKEVPRFERIEISSSRAVFAFLPGFFGPNASTAARKTFSIALLRAYRLTPKVREISLIGFSPLRAISTTRYFSSPVMSFHCITWLLAPALTIVTHLVGCSHPDQLVDRVTDFHLDVVALAGHPHVGLAQFAKEEQGMSSLLTQGETQGVLLTALLERFLHVTGDSVEAIGGAGAFYPLVGTLVVVVGNPVVKAPAGIRKGNKHRFFQKLPPNGLPEPFDLSQCHRMLWSASNVVYALLS